MASATKALCHAWLILCGLASDSFLYAHSTHHKASQGLSETALPPLSVPWGIFSLYFSDAILSRESTLIYLIFLRALFIFREGKGGRKRGRETSMCERNMNRLPLTRPQPGIWLTTQACALTGNQTGNLWVFGSMPYPLSSTSQG